MQIAKNIISVAAAALLVSMPAFVNADELKKEITLDKDVVTAQRDVNRQSITPAISLPEITPKNLAFSETSTMAKFSNSIALLDAATYANHLLDGPARGYVTAGYFPLLNANLAAGYQFIDNGKSKLNAWMNYNGTKYDREAMYSQELTVKRHHATVFVGGSHLINPRLELFANANGTFDTFNYPTLGKVDDQNSRQVLANIGVRSLANETRPFSYNARFKYNGVFFSKPVPVLGDDAKPITENKFSLIGGLGANIDEYAKVGLDFQAALTRYTGDVYDENEIGKYSEITEHNRTKIILNPFLEYSKGKATAHIGFEFKAAFSPKTKVYFAPDVNLGYRVFDWLGVNAHIGGGEIVNSFDRLLPIDIYASPNEFYGSGHSPLDALLSVNFGPFCGASLSLFGGYTIANDVITPDADYFAVYDNINDIPKIYPIGISRYQVVDMKGYRLGASVAYKFRNLVDFNATYQMAPQGLDKGYYPWLDHAHHVVAASVAVRPIDPLTVGLKYDLRTSRGSYIVTSAGTYKESLGTINSLGIFGAYRFNDNLRFHATVENLMNRHWDIIFGVPAPGITGLIGATYIFR